MCGISISCKEVGMKKWLLSLLGCWCCKIKEKNREFEIWVYAPDRSFLYGGRVKAMKCVFDPKNRTLVFETDLHEETTIMLGENWTASVTRSTR
jgi:hypothetical protein